MLKNLLFLKLFKDDAFISKENKTRGGDIERAEKELTVLPKFIPSTFIPTTVMPVENLLSTFLKSFLLIFSIKFFLKLTKNILYYNYIYPR